MRPRLIQPAKLNAVDPRERLADVLARINDYNIRMLLCSIWRMTSPTLILWRILHRLAFCLFRPGPPTSAYGPGTGPRQEVGIMRGGHHRPAALTLPAHEVPATHPGALGPILVGPLRAGHMVPPRVGFATKV